MRWLTPDGVAAALGVGLLVTWRFSWAGLALLGACLISGSLLSQFAERRAPRRNARQVIANGGVAALAACLGSLPAAAGALAAATADTWATEIGAFSPFPPRLIATGERVARGTSGGVTALGTLGGVAGAIVMGVLTRGVAPRGHGPGVLAVTGAGVAGLVLDSLLGATLQGRYLCPGCDARFERGNTVCHEAVRLVGGWRWLDNDAVNLTATLCGAVVAVLATHPALP